MNQVATADCMKLLFRGQKSISSQQSPVSKNPSTDLRAARTAKSLESTDSIQDLQLEARSV